MNTLSARGKRVSVHPGHSVATYRLLGNSLGDFRRLASRTICGIWFGRANLRRCSVTYVRVDFVEDILWLLSLFLQSVHLTAV